MHLYTYRTEATTEQLMEDAKMFGGGYDEFTPIRMKLTEIIENPSKMDDALDILEKGRAEKKLLILVNDISHDSLQNILLERLSTEFNLSKTIVFVNKVRANSFSV